MEVSTRAIHFIATHKPSLGVTGSHALLLEVVVRSPGFAWLSVTPSDGLCVAIKWIALVLTSTLALKETRASGRNVGKVS